jgi:hypothetical protein
MDGSALFADNGNEPQSFSTEKAAIARAEDWVKKSSDNEAWVYKLTHVVSRSSETKSESAK